MSLDKATVIKFVGGFAAGFVGAALTDLDAYRKHSLGQGWSLTVALRRYLSGGIAAGLATLGLGAVAGA